MLPNFDIFSGTPHGDEAFWLESVSDLEEAKHRMLSMATDNPGKYFVFSSSANRVVAEIETKASFVRR